MTSRTYALSVDHDATKSLKSVQEFNELDPASETPHGVSEALT